MTKPIDWTRPLRLIGSHKRVWVEGITPDADLPIAIVTEFPQRGKDPRMVKDAVDREGRSASGGDPIIENIPPEPRIVERWAVVRYVGQALGAADIYAFDPNDRILQTREAVESHRQTIKGPRLIARVLIEEPGE